MTDLKDNADKAPEREKANTPNLTRRSLYKASLAAPVILSAASRSAWGTEFCSISGFMSGNLSQPGGEDCSGVGCTPGFWKNNYIPWVCAGYNPGTCKKKVNGTYTVVPLLECHGGNPVIEASTGNTWGDMFSCPPPSGYDFTSATPLITILQSTGNGSDGLNDFNLPQHAVAAVLNASCLGEDYGPSPAEVIAAVCDVLSSGDVIRQEAFKNTLVRMNERGCPLGAQQSQYPLTMDVDMNGDGIPEYTDLPTMYNQSTGEYLPVIPPE